MACEQFRAGLRHDQTSLCRLRASAPSREALQQVLKELEGHGAVVIASSVEAVWHEAPVDGVAPEGFYSTTIYPTDVFVAGEWIRAAKQRMDAVLVIDPDRPSVRCETIRNLQAGDRIVCGVEGIAVHTPETNRTEEAFAFMSAGVSSERRVERVVQELAWEIETHPKPRGAHCCCSRSGGHSYRWRRLPGGNDPEWVCTGAIDRQCTAHA